MFFTDSGRYPATQCGGQSWGIPVVMEMEGAKEVDDAADAVKVLIHSPSLEPCSGLACGIEPGSKWTEDSQNMELGMLQLDNLCLKPEGLTLTNKMMPYWRVYLP